MLQTKIVRVSTDEHHTAEILQAAEILRAGGLVAFPTETVYGLGADALNERAVQKVFDAKGRPSDNPLIVHIASMENVPQFASSISDKGVQLAKRFWPGPMTLVVHKKNNVPDIVTAGLGTVALRIPRHPVTLKLLQQFQGGIVGPSANISGKPSPTSAEHVYHDLNGKIDCILDAGPTVIGVESTVIDSTVDPPLILRLGGLSTEEIEKEIGTIQKTENKELLRRSPGTRYRHYAPHAQVVLFPKSDWTQLAQYIHEFQAKKMEIGVITYSDQEKTFQGITEQKRLLPSLEFIAKNLFHVLREWDTVGIDVILIESVDETGIGAAIMDRLRKASSHG